MQANITYVPDPEVQEKLKWYHDKCRIMDVMHYFECIHTYTLHSLVICHTKFITITEQLQQLISTEEFSSLCFDCGYIKPCTQVVIDDKDDIIRAIALDFLIYRGQAEID